MYADNKSDRDRRYKARKFVAGLNATDEVKAALERMVEEGANVTALRKAVAESFPPSEVESKPEPRDVLAYWTDEKARAFTRTEEVRQVLVDAMTDRDRNAMSNYLHAAKNTTQEHIARFWQNRAERVLTGLA